MPARVPLVQPQFEVANALWPCTFHRNKKLTSLIDGTYFSTAELKIFDELFENRFMPVLKNVEKLILPSCPNLREKFSLNLRACHVKAR